MRHHFSLLYLVVVLAIAAQHRRASVYHKLLVVVTCSDKLVKLASRSVNLLTALPDIGGDLLLQTARQTPLGWGCLNRVVVC